MEYICALQALVQVGLGTSPLQAARRYRPTKHAASVSPQVMPSAPVSGVGWPSLPSLTWACPWEGWTPACRCAGLQRWQCYLHGQSDCAAAWALPHARLLPTPHTGPHLQDILTSPSHCGQDCITCSDPKSGNGKATCTDGICGIVCNEGEQPEGVPLKASPGSWLTC